jgi:hypothetical protein
MYKLQKHQIKNRERLQMLREKVKDVKPEVFAYLAGFYDGEGSLTVNGRVRTNGRIRRSRVPYVCIKMSHNKKEPLALFASVFGGKYYETFKVTAKDGSGGRYLYHYRSNLNETRVTLECLLPYLIVKKEQAQLALHMFDKSDTLIWKEFKEEKIKLIEQIRSYNEKGKSLIQVNKVTE